MNASPRGGEKHKKACTMTEEGEEDEDTEVFRVPRAMAEEQRDMLGMLTQTLAQVAERLAAAEARNEERLAMEQERMATDREEEWLELERVQTTIMQQWMEDLWRIGTLMQSPFIYSSKGKERAVETEAEVEAEEKGEEADNEDEDVQGEEE
ncbi:hypothetical protein SCLCIDRAFT_18549 [Scleroderma citrinum Foug A]|uniref:Uncharacterized protein n=1 Tax=Scleroderma citrinum Foug A TaxID=1036808 RepID=A0A0C3ECF1_9AGAM|nr:hypothetical protein SCLCIDRAFT_18549 [Scleroderma citrinum Foug A]